jgi:hypothetical protein
MSQLREVITRMAVDPEFADRVRSNPDDIAAEFNLTAEETEQVLALTDAPADDGPEALDPRLSKSGIGAGGVAGLLAAFGKPKDDDRPTEGETRQSRWIGPGNRAE